MRNYEFNIMGIINMRIIYASNPGKAAEITEISTYAIRTSVESIPKYSAKPPQTPANIRSFERVNFFFVSIVNLLKIVFTKIKQI